LFGSPDPKGGAAEAERRVPQGADRLLSRWPEEHAGQKEIDLVCRFPGQTWRFIHLFSRRDSNQLVAEVNFLRSTVFADKQ
jgi:hypothetical protein